MNEEVNQEAVEAGKIPAFLKRDEKPEVTKEGDKEAFVQTEAEVGGKPVN